MTVQAMALFSVILLICVTLAAAQNSKDREEGDECLEKTADREAWFCKLVNNCPAAVKLFKERKIPPKHLQCGFKGQDSLVCCPPYEISDWNSTASTSKLPNELTVGTPASAAASVSATSSAAPGEKAAANRHRDAVDFPLKRGYVHPVVIPPDFGHLRPMSMHRVATECTGECEEYRIWQDQTYLVQSGPFQTKQCEHVALLNVNVNAEPKEFPHTALIGFGPEPSYLCSGSLISERFVLSAAHCSNSPKFGPPITVLLGELNITSDTDDAMPQSYRISRIFVHPEFERNSHYNDIMLVELEKEVKFSLYVRPLCLHTSKNIAPYTGYAPGWGTLASDPFGPFSPMMQKIKVPFINYKACNESYKTYVSSNLKFGIVDETQLCAGGEKGKGACKGSSGSPLQIMLGDCMSSQVGLVSFGRGCGIEGLPDVFTRVSAYIPWIENIVWP